MRYRDFDLKLERSRGTGFLVEAISTPVRERSASLPLSVPEREAAEWRAKLRNGMAGRQALEALGRTLFQSLFPPPILNLWERSEEALGADDGLRLRLDARDPGLASLPWEAVHNGRYHLAMSPRRQVVRYFYDRPEILPAENDAPLNVLLAVSVPRDAPYLPAVEMEVSHIGRCLGELEARGMVGRVDILRGASLGALQRQLRRPYHVLHYMGHGAFSGDAGYLLLETEDGRAQQVDAQTLSYFFRETSLRLLVLNSCGSAAHSQKDPLLGVAQAALGAGVPAVVAMQDAVVDEVAACFAREFYQTLVEGFPLESCMAEGRKAILTCVSPERADWVTPVLFSNAREGLLWKAPPAESSTERPASSAATAAPKNVVKLNRVKAKNGVVIMQGDGNTYSTSSTPPGYGGAGEKNRRGKKGET